MIEEGTQPQQAPQTSYVTVPGPGAAMMLVILAALVLVVARRRLQ